MEDKDVLDMNEDELEKELERQLLGTQVTVNEVDFDPLQDIRDILDQRQHFEFSSASGLDLSYLREQETINLSTLFPSEDYRLTADIVDMPLQDSFDESVDDHDPFDDPIWREYLQSNRLSVLDGFENSLKEIVSLQLPSPKIVNEEANKIVEKFQREACNEAVDQSCNKQSCLIDQRDARLEKNASITSFNARNDLEDFKFQSTTSESATIKLSPHEEVILMSIEDEISLAAERKTRKEQEEAEIEAFYSREQQRIRDLMDAEKKRQEELERALQELERIVVSAEEAATQEAQANQLLVQEEAEITLSEVNRQEKMIWIGTENTRHLFIQMKAELEEFFKEQERRLEKQRLEQLEYERLVKRIIAAGIIQRAWNCNRWRKRHVWSVSLRKKSAKVIQRWWKLHKQQMEQKRLTIEKQEREAILEKEAKRREEKRKEDLRLEQIKKKTTAAIRFQRLWRDFQARKSMHEKKTQSTIIIQKKWRSFILQRSYKQLAQQEHASLMIQRHWRGTKGRLEFNKRKEYVLQEKQKKQRHHSAIIIQSLWRGVISRRIVCFSLIQRACICIQRWWKKREIVNQRDHLSINLEDGVVAAGNKNEWICIRYNKDIQCKSTLKSGSNPIFRNTQADDPKESRSQCLIHLPKVVQLVNESDMTTVNIATSLYDRVIEGHETWSLAINRLQRVNTPEHVGNSSQILIGPETLHKWMPGLNPSNLFRLHSLTLIVESLIEGLQVNNRVVALQPDFLQRFPCLTTLRIENARQNQQNSTLSPLSLCRLLIAFPPQLTSLSLCGTLDNESPKDQKMIDLALLPPTLQYLDLSGNGIDIWPIQNKMWLPALNHLNLSRNRIRTFSCDSQPVIPSLKHLDVSSNDLHSFKELVPMLRETPQLEVLDTRNNPFFEDVDNSLSILVPHLKTFNGNNYHVSDSVSNSLNVWNIFVPQRQGVNRGLPVRHSTHESKDKLSSNHNLVHPSLSAPIYSYSNPRAWKAATLHHVACQSSLALMRAYPSGSFNRSTETRGCAANIAPNSKEAKRMKKLRDGIVNRITVFQMNQNRDCFVKCNQTLQHFSAIRIQTWWRREEAKSAMRWISKYHTDAATCIQRVYRGYSCRKKVLPLAEQAAFQKKVMNEAAVKIQKIVRGFLIRSALTRALQRVRYLDVDEEEFPEIDLHQFIVPSLIDFSSTPPVPEFNTDVRATESIDRQSKFLQEDSVHRDSTQTNKKAAFEYSSHTELSTSVVQKNSPNKVHKIDLRSRPPSSASTISMRSIAGDCMDSGRKSVQPAWSEECHFKNGRRISASQILPVDPNSRQYENLRRRIQEKLKEEKMDIPQKGNSSTANRDRMDRKRKNPRPRLVPAWMNPDKAEPQVTEQRERDEQHGESPGAHMRVVRSLKQPRDAPTSPIRSLSLEWTSNGVDEHIVHHLTNSSAYPRLQHSGSQFETKHAWNGKSSPSPSPGNSSLPPIHPRSSESNLFPLGSGDPTPKHTKRKFPVKKSSKKSNSR